MKDRYGETTGVVGNSQRLKVCYKGTEEHKKRQAKLLLLGFNRPSKQGNWHR